MFAVIKTFVTDISASTGTNDFIFDIWERVGVFLARHSVQHLVFASDPINFYTEFG
jgi:hypothetical protein